MILCNYIKWKVIYINKRSYCYYLHASIDLFRTFNELRRSAKMQL